MTAAIAAILAVALAVLAGLLAPPLLRRRRRRLAFSEVLPEPMRAAIARNVPVTRRLPQDLARRLEGLVISFLAEKQFVGCNGLAITDEIRATIAAQACLLLLGRLGLYDELQSILVYPGAFWVEDEVHDDDGLVTQRRRELSGEAWDSHRIILSWEDVEETARQPADGYNVVLHEFAHYLDAEGRGLAPLPPIAGESTSGRDAGPSTPGTRTWSLNTKRSATPWIAASRRFSIPTQPKTRSSSSRWPARNSSSAPGSCRQRIHACHSLLAWRESVYGSRSCRHGAL